MRTTIDLDPTILDELKTRAKSEGKTLGQLTSELLAPVLKHDSRSTPDFHWPTRELGPFLVDLEDKEAVQAILDEEEIGGWDPR